MKYIFTQNAYVTAIIFSADSDVKLQSISRIFFVEYSELCITNRKNVVKPAKANFLGIMLIILQYQLLPFIEKLSAAKF